MEIWAEKYRNEAISELRRSWGTIRSIDPSTNNPKSGLEPFPASSEHSRYLPTKTDFFPDLRIAVDPAGGIRWDNSVIDPGNQPISVIIYTNQHTLP